MQRVCKNGHHTQTTSLDTRVHHATIFVDGLDVKLTFWQMLIYISNCLHGAKTVNNYREQSSLRVDKQHCRMFSSGSRRVIHLRKENIKAAELRSLFSTMSLAFGVTVISDGYSHAKHEGLSEDTPADKREYLQFVNAKKIFILANRLLVAVAGGSNWMYVLDHLQLVAHKPKWTAERCAKFAKHLFESDYVPPPELYKNFKTGDRDERACSMMFASVDDGKTRVFVASKEEVHEVKQRSSNEGAAGIVDLEKAGYGALGSGSQITNKCMTWENDSIWPESANQNVLNLIKMMKMAVLGDKYTGGYLSIHHLSPDGHITRIREFHADEIDRYFEYYELYIEPKTS